MAYNERLIECMKYKTIFNVLTACMQSNAGTIVIML